MYSRDSETLKAVAYMHGRTLCIYDELQDRRFYCEQSTEDKRLLEGKCEKFRAMSRYGVIKKKKKKRGERYNRVRYIRVYIPFDVFADLSTKRPYLRRNKVA